MMYHVAYAETSEKQHDMMNKSENSMMNICAAALVHYAAICGFSKTVYAER